MALDRDELAARATAARAALLSLCDALAALSPVAPASGAPATDPRRTVGAVVRWINGDDEYVIVSPDGCRAVRNGVGAALFNLRDTDTFVRWATREECERHSIPHVARPLPGAPLAAPSRPDPVAVFTCPKCGSNEFGTSNCTSHYSEWVGHCDKCRFSWPREKDDAKYFADPSPAATPAAWVPSVGDVVGIDGGKEYDETRVVTKIDRSAVSYVRLNANGGVICDHTTDVSLLTFVRRATSSERAAAGLPVDESAVDAPAFDEAKEREAAKVAVSRDAGDDFTRGWLARARVAAKGGVA